MYISCCTGVSSSIPSTKSVPLHFTTETLAIAVASAAIGALILGFITGFFCGKKCNKEEDNQLYAVTDYEYYDQRQTPNRSVGCYLWRALFSEFCDLYVSDLCKRLGI